jgi:hypothetical protein
MPRGRPNNGTLIALLDVERCEGGLGDTVRLAGTVCNSGMTRRTAGTAAGRCSSSELLESGDGSPVLVFFVRDDPGTGPLSLSTVQTTATPLPDLDCICAVLVFLPT